MRWGGTFCKVLGARPICLGSISRSAGNEEVAGQVLRRRIGPPDPSSKTFTTYFAPRRGQHLHYLLQKWRGLFMDYLKQIEAVLGPSGILANSIDGYEHREQQIRMAKEVYEALTSEDRLVIEAPTGTGKTSRISLPLRFPESGSQYPRVQRTSRNSSSSRTYHLFRKKYSPG